jgi:hypothetical protein
MCEFDHTRKQSNIHIAKAWLEGVAETLHYDAEEGASGVLLHCGAQ